VIYFEDAQCSRPTRLSVWERIEASAEYQVLLNAIVDRFGQAILGVPAAHHDM
jgi:cytochrome c-type biogenesis protein CcmH/NrfF